MNRALLLVLALAGCQSGKMERVLHPPTLATTWIGVASDGLTWYRLSLDDNGTGSGATTRGRETCFYRVPRWSSAEEMTVHMELVDGAPDAARRLDLRGSPMSWKLDLAVEGRHSVTLWREDDLISARDRMIRHGSTTTANPP